MELYYLRCSWIRSIIQIVTAPLKSTAMSVCLSRFTQGRTSRRTAANRAVRYSRDGTGLSPKFPELVKKARIKFADLLASLKDHASRSYVLAPQV
jgi:hypothetical protein